MIQTNGTLLPNVSDDLLTKIDTILISLDGDEEATDRWEEGYNWQSMHISGVFLHHSSRGEGTYDQVIDATRDARERGFTVSGFQDKFSLAFWLIYFSQIFFSDVVLL